LSQSLGDLMLNVLYACVYEVVNSFNGCSDFFYKNEEPSGFDQNAIKICQKLRNRYFYATLYSTYHRIPLYSAYKFDYHCRKNKEARPSGNCENKYQSNSIKNSQAINADYARSGYDRGHLSPNSFQCNEGREVTFTLTNSAPMVGRFNRVHWRKWESAVRKLLEKQDPSGTAYLVTGTVPDLNRVTVPSHVWTAVCYYNEIKRDKSFSFGFIGENDQDGSIGFKTIPHLFALFYEDEPQNVFCQFYQESVSMEHFTLFGDVQLV
uniref:Uncharacterized protein n=1 Tax=Anabas testudineus TaxID=64144 RepID=A0A3Q1JJJ2_ANATE